MSLAHALFYTTSSIWDGTAECVSISFWILVVECHGPVSLALSPCSTA